MSTGVFITLEGTDGAGKTTQIENIRRYFEDKGRAVVITREPGGTSIGEKLREILLDRENSEMTAVTEMLLYAAARAQHVEEHILPAIERGDVVICDRFVDSSIAYQGYGRELGEQVQVVNKYATLGLEPDITFFLDLSPLIGKNRIEKGTEDRLESEKMDFHMKVYEGYIHIADMFSDRVIRIDASAGIESVKTSIYAVLDKFCNARGI